MNTKERKYTEEFKKQIVELYENVRVVTDPAREYGLVEQTVYKWIHRYEPFAKKTNRGGEENSDAGRHKSHAEMDSCA